MQREPDPADARAKRLYLTAAGERLAVRSGAVQAAMVTAMTEAESSKALAEVTAQMLRVSERLQAMLDEPA